MRFWKPCRGKNHSKGDADSRLSKMRKTNPKIQKIAYTVLLVIGEEREMERVYKKSFQRVLLLRESEKWGSIRSENCNQKKVFKKQ